MWNMGVGQTGQLKASGFSVPCFLLFLATAIDHCVASGGGAGFFIYSGQRGPKIDELEVGSGGGLTTGPLGGSLLLCRYSWSTHTDSLP